MSVYFIVQEEIHDAARLAEYGPLARAAASSGKVLAAGTPTVIEGDWHGGRLIVMEFPDEAAFKAWYDSPAYQTALKVRLEATDSRAALVPSVG